MLSFKNIIEKNRNILRILLIANAIFIAMMCIFPQLGDYLMPSTNIYEYLAEYHAHRIPRMSVDECC